MHTSSALLLLQSRHRFRQILHDYPILIGFDEPESRSHREDIAGWDFRLHEEHHNLECQLANVVLIDGREMPKTYSVVALDLWRKRPSSRLRLELTNLVEASSLLQHTPSLSLSALIQHCNDVS